MSTTPVGTWVRAKVRGRCPHLETAVRKCIFDTDSKREWVAWLWIEHIFHHGSMWFLLGCGPGCPANKAVDCVTALWLVQRELVAVSVKFVAAILQPVWPRDQYLAPARGAHFVSSVSVDKLPATRGVGAKSSTNLDDHGLLITDCDRDLPTGWCDHRRLRRLGLKQVLRDSSPINRPVMALRLVRHVALYYDEAQIWRHAASKSGNPSS